jgi:mRNA interferase RelE/StbE
VTYQIEVLPKAQKALAALDKPERRRVQSAIDGLAENPRPASCIKMTGESGWRIRVGKVRVVYEIRDAVLLVTVIKLGYRRDVYER